MKLHEILTTEIPEDCWFRPVGWKGCAYTIKDDYIIYVPTANGGHPSMTHYVEYLAGDWEIVKIDAVFSERA